MAEPNLYIACIAYPVTALGPGCRIGIWLTGCSRHCAGCISPEFQTRNVRQRISPTILFEHLRSLDRSFRGLTISGGEPLDQPAGLELLLRLVRQEASEWDVILYTGYKWKNLSPDARRHRVITEGVDLLIDGPFCDHLPSRHPLTGSGNQTLIAISNKGRALLHDSQTLPASNWDLGRFSFDTWNPVLIDGGQHFLIGVLDPVTRRAVHRRMCLIPVNSYQGVRHEGS